MAGLGRLVIGVALVLIGFLLSLSPIGFVAGVALMVIGVILLYAWALVSGTTDGRGEDGVRPDSRWGIAQGWARRLDELWTTDPKGMSIDLLRVGVGIVWALNLIFIVDPANQFFPTFQSVVLSFAPTSLGGPGVANFVAAHAIFFAGVTAALTAYLAAAFLLGITTRLACVIGGAASIAFLLTQFLSTFQIPGGTDVGPHPLYLLIYLVLFAGGAGRYLAIDHWIWMTGHARYPRLSRWLAAPRQ